MAGHVRPERIPQCREIAARAADAIGSADAKATALMNLLAVVLGLVTIGAGNGGNWSPVQGLMYSLYLGLSTTAIVACCLVVWPRTGQKRLLRGRQTLARSPTYFADIAAMSFGDFVAQTDGVTDEALEMDAAEQAYILARIADAKMRWMRRSFVMAAVAVTSLGALVFMLGWAGRGA